MLSNRYCLEHPEATEEHQHGNRSDAADDGPILRLPVKAVDDIPERRPLLTIRMDERRHGFSPSRELPGLPKFLRIAVPLSGTTQERTAGEEEQHCSRRFHASCSALFSRRQKIFLGRDPDLASGLLRYSFINELLSSNLFRYHTGTREEKSAANGPKYI